MERSGRIEVVGNWAPDTTSDAGLLVDVEGDARAELYGLLQATGISNRSGTARGCRHIVRIDGL